MSLWKAEALLLVATLGGSVAALAGAQQAPPATTLAAAEASAEPAPAEPEDEARPQGPGLTIDPKAALFDHLHNKIVHFPLAAGVLGAVLLLLSYRWPQFGPGARFVLLVAAVSAWAAVWTGLGQAEDLEGGELGVWLERHELFGEITATALTLTAIAALVRQARAFAWLLALLLLGLVGYTGFLGGILAHTPV
jgi:uncharacterized membrane protein